MATRHATGSHHTNVTGAIVISPSIFRCISAYLFMFQCIDAAGVSRTSPFLDGKVSAGVQLFYCCRRFHVQPITKRAQES